MRIDNPKIYDVSNSAGLSTQILSSNSNGVAWSSFVSLGIITGSGTINVVPKFTPSGVQIGDSNISDNGTTVTVNAIFSATGVSTFVGLGTFNNGLNVRGRLLDANISSGSSGNILSSTGSGIAWSSLVQLGLITGSGTPNRLAKFTPTGVQIGDSNVSDNGTTVTVSSDLSVTGVSTFVGLGTFNNGLNIRGRLIDANLSGGSSGNILSSTGSGIAWSTLVQLGIITGSGTINFIPKFTPTGVQIGNSNISDNGTTVNIGSDLSVTGVSTFIGLGTFNNGLNIRGRLLDVNISSGSSGNILSSTGSGIAWSTLIQLGLVTGTGSATQITYWSNANQITGSSTFIYTGLGSVGIGTAIPTQFLHVQGASRLNGGIYDSNNQIGSVGQFLSSTGSGIAWTTASATIGGSISDRQIAFGNGSNAIAGISTFVYTAAGNVGIGTATPTQFLHVQGNTRITGGIYDSNNSVGSSGNILSSTGSGIAWSSLVQLGVITGSGTINALAKFTPTGVQIGNSNVSDNGTTVTVSSDLSVTGVSTFIGLGTFNNGLNIRGRLIDVNLSSGSSSNILSSTGSGIAWSTLVQLGIITGSGTINFVPKFTPTGVQIGNSNISDNGTTVNIGSDLSVIGVSTFIGLGTFNNGLNIRGRLIDANISSGSSGNILSSTGSGIAWSTSVQLGLVTGTGSATQIAYWSNSNQITGSSTFIYTGLGSVGIGTAIPTQFLHIQGASRLNGGIYDSNNQIGLAGSVLSSTGAGIAWTAAANSSATIGGSISSTQIAYGNGSNSITGSNNYVINPTSQVRGVGIGTAAPTADLEIVGIASRSVLRLTPLGTHAFIDIGHDINNGAEGSGIKLSLNGNRLDLFSAGSGYGTPTQTGPLIVSNTDLKIYVGVTSKTFFNEVTVITSAGAIGVKTTAPTQDLHIQGNTRITGGIYDSNNLAGSSGDILSSTGSGIAWSTLVQLGIITGSGTLNRLAKFTPTGVQIGDSNVSDNGTTVTVSSDFSVTGVSTFVGLGTFNNGLNIRGRLIDANLSGGSSGNILSSTGSGIAWSTSVQLGFVTGTGSATQIAYWSNANQITGTSTFVYTGLGSVGIGTAIPTQFLHVQGPSRLNGGIYDSNNQIGSVGNILSSTGSGIAWSTAVQLGVITGSGTINTLAKFTPTGVQIGNSNVSDNGTTVTVNSILSVTGASTFVGFGSFQNRLSATGNPVNWSGSERALFVTGSATSAHSGFYTLNQTEGSTAHSTGTINWIAGGLNRIRVQSTGGTVSNVYGMQNLAWLDSASGTPNISNNVGAYYEAIWSNVNFSGNATVGSNVALQVTNSHVTVTGGGQAVIGNEYGILLQAAVNTGILITNRYGIRVNDPTGTTGALTNQYGIYLEDLDRAGTSNYAIYLDGTSGLARQGIWWAGDTNIYRSAANTLKTDDSFIVSQNLDVTGVSTFVGLGTFNSGLNIRGRLLDANLSSGSSGNILSSTGSGIAWSTSVQLGLVTGTGSATQIAYWSNANQITGSSTFIYTGLGSVGIGTAIPTQFLHVQGASRFNGGIYDSNNQIGLAGSVLSSTGSGIAWTAAGSGSATIGGSIADRQIAFGNGSNTIAGISTFVYSSLGRVGLGTASPQSSLQVYGDATNIAINPTNSTDGVVLQVSEAGTVNPTLLLRYASNQYLEASAVGGSNRILALGADLSLETNASENVVLAPFAGHVVLQPQGAGNIGVKTAIPTQDLHVQGNTRITGGIYDSNNSVGSSGNILSSTGSGIAWSTLVQLGIITGSGTINTLAKFTPTGVQIGNSNVSDNGTTVTVSSDLSVTGVSTFVGLGTFNNGLNIRGRLLDANISSGSSGNILSSTGSGIAWSTSVQLGLVTGTGSATQITYWSNANQITGSSTFIYTGLGSVGIGTATPTQFLHVQGASRLNGGIYDSNNQIGLAGSVLSSTGSGIAWTAAGTGTGNGTIGGSIADDQIAFGNGSNAIAGISTFVYTGIGSVGIGTATPTQFLHVQGASRFNGGIYDSNNSIGVGGSVLSSTGSGVAWISVATAERANLNTPFTNVGIVTVNHNFGVYPVVEILDNNNRVIIPEEVQHTNTNTFVVYFAENTTGTVIAVNGGDVGVGTLATIGGSIADRQIAFGNGSNTIAGVSTFIYTGLGSVGIGSASPTTRLDVVGDITARTSLSTSLLYTEGATSRLVLNFPYDSGKALRIHRNVTAQTTYTTFRGISTVNMPLNTMLSIEGMMNGFATGGAAYEAGTFYAAFVNAVGIASQISTVDVNSKSSGVDEPVPCFNVVGVGSNVEIHVKAGTATTWAWRGSYSYLITENTWNGAGPNPVGGLIGGDLNTNL